MSLKTAAERTKTRVSRKGAKCLHAQGKAHKYTSENARKAAQKRWAKVNGEIALNQQDVLG